MVTISDEEINEWRSANRYMTTIVSRLGWLFFSISLFVAGFIVVAVLSVDDAGFREVL